ncbi:MAG TPA: copper-translocating P-type ATPase, partial [Chloroflexota bacterium]|nr:copper-translocating P-type ATPase [Chloroflexota bacterium]
TVDGEFPSEFALRQLVKAACGEANPVPLPPPDVSSHQYVHDVYAPPGHEAPAQAEGMAHTHHDLANPATARAMENDIRRRFWISLVLAVPVFLYSSLATNLLGLHLPTPFGLSPNLVMFVFTTPIALWTSSVFHLGAWQSIRSGYLNMSVLVSLGILVSYLFSVGLTIVAPGMETFYEAAAMLAVFLLFGHWMEMKARRGSSDAVRKLLTLAPREAHVERNGQIVTVPVDRVVPGDVVVLLPGEKVPVDGVVIDGNTTLDEAMVTGESLPVAKGPAASVLAGTLNQAGSVRFRATHVGADTALAQIVALVERAQNSKAPAQRLADRAAHYLVIVAVGAGLLTFLIWFGVARAPLLEALTFAVTVVVIACPDALGLATPTAVMVATDLAAKHGILFKEAVALEQTARIQTVVFDKTGTLTEGKPRVTDVIALDGVSEDELLRLEAAAEARSGHPLSQAILAETRRRDIAIPTDVSEFEAMSGLGVRARVEGHNVLVGTRRLLEGEGVSFNGNAERAEQLLAEGKTLVLVAIDGKLAGIVAAADQVRPGAREAVNGLRELGIEVVMMTGDNRHTADAVARDVGIRRVFADVLPGDKANEVKRLQNEGKFVAMVGDGINDAPALAQADVGIAIGAGTDVAVETGAVVLMKSDPADVLTALRLSQATVRKMKENLFWAAIYNLIAIPIAAGVLYPSLGLILRPEFGALAMSASSITVVTNALLLRRTPL